MEADAMATRMSVLTRALPMRILLVDDDELELELIAERLAGAGFEVHQASNGAEALELLAQRWYPVIVTDWQMPIMDGIAFTQALRARGCDDTYLIMLTSRHDSSDYERGYAAGVDDYLTKKVPDAELFARINAAFNTLALRRSLKAAQEALEQSVSIDAESGAFTARELRTRLHAEIARAQRYGRPLSLITVALHPSELPSALLRQAAETLMSVVRAHVDWVGRLEKGARTTFAVVLPEASIGDGPAIKDRLLGALGRLQHPDGSSVGFTFGLVALDRGTGSEGATVEAVSMLEVAERCRACSGRVGTDQLEAVRMSVAGHVAIACRHGYAIAGECPLRSRVQ